MVQNRSIHDYVMVTTISAAQAHEVAMVAAHAVTICIDQPAALHNIGQKIAEAYLQAYEAVEGWTKPLTPMKASEPKSDQKEVERVYFCIGNEVSLINKASGRGFTVKLCDDGSWVWDSLLPKDA